MSAAAEPVFIFDGDCGFCTRSVDWLRRHVRPRAEVIPYQFADLARYGVTAEQADREALWVAADGRVFGGVRAFAGLLATASPAWRLAGAVLDTRPVRLVAGALYRLVARNRHRLPGGTPACAVRPPAPASSTQPETGDPS